MNYKNTIISLKLKYLNNKNIFKNLDQFMNLAKNLLQRKNNLVRNLKNNKNK